MCLGSLFVIQVLSFLFFPKTADSLWSSNKSQICSSSRKTDVARFNILTSIPTPPQPATQLPKGGRERCLLVVIELPVFNTQHIRAHDGQSSGKSQLVCGSSVSAVLCVCACVWGLKRITPSILTQLWRCTSLESMKSCGMTDTSRADDAHGYQTLGGMICCHLLSFSG